MAARFTMSFMTVGSAATTAPAPAPPASRVRQLLDEHRPLETVDNMALIIMDQTYGALLEILGPEAPPPVDGHVQVARPVDPADPDSPLLSVSASATHCCIRLIDGSLYGGATAPLDHSLRLPRATITAAPGALHLARITSAAGGGGRGEPWTCADVRPDVSNRGLFGVLEAIRLRVGAAIRLEEAMLGMARGSGCRQGPKVREIADVRVALERMREAVDLDAIMHGRRCRKRRRRFIQEEIITCRPDVDRAYHDDGEALAKRLSALHVGKSKKRGCPEMRCRQADDEEVVLAKRLRTLHV